MREARRKIQSLRRDEAKTARTSQREQAAAATKRNQAILGGAKGLGKTAIGLGAVALGGVALGAMAEEAIDTERALTRLQIATNKTPAQMGALREELNKSSGELGLSRGSLLEGASAYVALTGDAEGAAEAMKLFGKVSNATGSSMADIAATAAAMKDNLGIDPKDFEAGFSALAVQGKEGAVELRELATELSGIAPSFAQFKGGKGAAGLAEMGASLQVIRKGFGSSSEAATGMRALMVSIARHADKFRKAGVQIYDKDPKTGKKRLRDFSDIIDAIGKSKLANSPTLLTDAFGSDEAKRAYDQLIQNRKLLDDLIARSSDANAINRDAATYQQSAAGRIEAAWNKVKLAVAEAFSPERIEIAVKLIEKAAAAFEVVGRFMNAYLMSDEEHQENLRNHQRRENDIQKIRNLHAAKGRSVTYEQAEEQLNTELAQLKMLRDGTGTYDTRKASDLAEMRSHIVERGSFLLQNDFLKELDVRIGRSMARELTAATAPLTNLSRLAGAFPGSGTVIVKMGLNEVARAHHKAPDHRTKPGGR